MQRKALVTGGAGFIGSHLVERLLERGWEVRILDNFSSGSRERAAALRERAEVLDGDIRSERDCRKACEGVDTVFHMAAIASVASSVADPAYSHDVNVGGTLNMLMAARDLGVRRLVFSSSAAVYGNVEVAPTDEEQPIRPESPYASGKACGELYCRNFHSLYGLETVVLRYFNVFGPGQSAVSGYAAVIPAFVEAAARLEVPVIYGDGRQTRDFVYVSNVVDANVRAALAEGVAGETFNVAGGQAITLLDLLEELSVITRRHIRPEFRPGREGEVRHSRADIRRARERLGYSPSVALGEGLARTLAAVPAAAPAAVLSPAA